MKYFGPLLFAVVLIPVLIQGPVDTLLGYHYTGSHLSAVVHGVMDRLMGAAVAMAVWHARGYAKALARQKANEKPVDGPGYAETPLRYTGRTELGS
jgi:hypothetical protein